ncbi:MAG TPA: hypothetical protein VGM47_01245 [Gammaproteobacteria bacterium]
MFVLGCATAWAADDMPIPATWKLASSIPEEPIRDIYIGKATFLHYADLAKPDAGSATFKVWGKYVYKKPQVRGSVTYSADVVEFTLDCAASTVTRLREALQDADGKTLVDDKKQKTTRHVDLKDMEDVGTAPPEDIIAFIASDFTCAADLD